MSATAGMALEPVPAAPAADPFGGGASLNRAEAGRPGTTEPAKDTASRADLEAIAATLSAPTPITVRQEPTP